MSEIEQLFSRLQEKTGGTVTWHQLHPVQQQQFIDCVNFIIRLTSSK